MEWPIWYCLILKCQQALKTFQMINYGIELEPPSFHPEVEDIEEIDRLMRQPPASRGSLSDGD